jgi:phosphonate transport system ATP-binding protein
MMLKVSKLNKIYSNGVHALKDVDLEVKKGEFLVIIGLSGSGKSTLLRCINQIHSITSGQVFFNGNDITHFKGNKLRNIRSKIGMIFQHFNLIPRKTVLTNVLTGKLGSVDIFKGITASFSQQEKLQALKNIGIVGLDGKENERADNLSGGQQQRVSIARALMQNPELLLADEPVASLDPATSHSVMKYLEKINKSLGVTIICNLHFLSLVRKYASRVIALKDGEVVFEGSPQEIDNDWFKKIYGEEAVEVTID